MMTRLMGIATIVWALVPASPAAAADATYPLLGQVRPRHAREIAASPWSVGGETLDRDYAVYANYKSYLGPLGVKRIRLQAGWAKCEKTPGQYDWAWLDEVVDDALAQGVAPWLETSYGNPIYEGGGGAGLGGGLPTGDKALAAWDAWVAALVGRYRDRVVEWEIWNEPDLNKKNTAADYAAFYIRTAEIIRRQQPKARLLALAIAGIGNTAYVESFLKPLAEQKKLHLVDQITVHGYPENPDSSYPTLAKLLKVVRKYDAKIPLRQGENGAPSTKTVGALSRLKTSQTVQAKWDLRRMMGDLGHDMESNVFTLMELRYRGGRMDGWNTKGILKAAPDMTVEQPKQAYYAVQNVTAIFDNTLGRIQDFACRTELDQPLAAYAYRRADGACAATLWLSGKVPADANDKTPADITLTGVKFAAPLWVDLRTGEVRAIPAENWKAGSDGCTFRAVPLYDSPVVIAEKSLVPLAPAK